MALFSRIIAINSSGQKLILARLKKMVLEHSRKIGATRHISQEFCLQIQPARGAEEARSASESNSSRHTNTWGSTRAATDSLLDKVDKDKEESNKASEVFREIQQHRRHQCCLAQDQVSWRSEVVSIPHFGGHIRHLIYCLSSDGCHDEVVET